MRDQKKSRSNGESAILRTAIGAVVVLPLLSWTPGVQSAEEGSVEPVPVDTVPSADPTSPAEPATRGSIDEIVVTAQKREENLQDVPISISAFTAAQLEAKGTTTTKDLGQITPGLQITEVAGYTFIYLRGVGSDAFIASADPSVATYVDGLYVPIGHGFAQELGGVERVEVLKGPQGTLFGRNSTGGAISVTTRKPSDELETSLTFNYGSFDSYGAKAYVSIPLSPSLAISVAGLYRGGESYYDRKGPNEDHGIPDDVIKGYRLRARWNPSDDTELLLTAQRVNVTAAGSLVSANRRPSALLGTALLIPATQEDFVTEADTDPNNASYQRSFYGTFTWSVPWFDVKLLGEDLLNDVTSIQTDFDGSSQPYVSFNSPHEFTDIKTAELQIVSNKGSWGSDWLTWVGGVFYLKSTAGFDPVLLQVANSAVALPTGDVINLIPEALRDLLPPLPSPDSVTLYLEGLLATRSVSAYAQTTAKVTDWFSITGGGRLQKEKRAQIRSTVNVENSDGGLTPILPPYAPQEKTITNFSPKVSFDFHVADDTLVYLSAAKGFKSQTYNIINIYTQPEYVKPEELTAFELGLKSTLFDGTLRINGAVFQNKTKNLQSSFISLLAGGAVKLENAGGARTRGAEADIVWLPLPELDPGLQLTGGAAYLDARYTSFRHGSGFDPVTGLQESDQDFTGNRVTRTPKWTSNVGVAQTIETSSGPIDLGIDGYYDSGFYFLPQNGELSHEPRYALLNAHAGILIDALGLRLTAFGANLTDKKYNISQFHTDFGRLDTLAPPRTWGVRLNWDF